MSGLAIKINAGSNQETSSVQATGSLQHIVTDLERSTFGILDGDLKRKVGAYMEREPNDAYVKSPTPWKDLYKKYGWDQVKTVLCPIETKILSVDTVPTIISRQVFKNKRKKTSTVTGKISAQVSTTVETAWSNSNTVSVNQDISYNFKLTSAEVGGKTSLGYEGQWGKSGSNSKTATVGTEAGVSVELEPGEEVVAELSANAGKMKVRVTFEARLDGQTAVNYYPTFKGHHFYGIDISALLGASNSVKITEDIEIGYYGEVYVTVRNLAGDTLKCERCA